MELVIGISVVTCLALALALPLLLRKVPHSHASLPVTAEWIDELSIERYRPMLRLLDAEDLEFLRSQPGYTRAIEKKFRMERCQVLRGYLGCLDADFGRVCTAIKVLMLQSRHDRPDLAAALVRNQVRFGAGMALVRMRLVLYGWGLSAGDVTSLVQIFDQVSLDLRSMMPAQIPAGA